MLRLLQSLIILPSIAPDTIEAMRIQQRYSIQFFDAMLLSTAKRAGCSVFFSEDMQDQQDYDGITVRNPFAASFNLDEFFA